MSRNESIVNVGAITSSDIVGEFPSDMEKEQMLMMLQFSSNGTNHHFTTNEKGGSVYAQ